MASQSVSSPPSVPGHTSPSPHVPEKVTRDMRDTSDIVNYFILRTS